MRAIHLYWRVRALPPTLTWFYDIYVRAVVKAEEAASASLKAEESKKGDFDTTFRQVSFLPPLPALAGLIEPTV